MLRNFRVEDGTLQVTQPWHVWQTHVGDCGMNAVQGDPESKIGDCAGQANVYVGPVEIPDVGRQQTLRKGPGTTSCNSFPALATCVPPGKILNFFKPWFSICSMKGFIRCCNFSNLVGAGRWNKWVEAAAIPGEVWALEDSPLPSALRCRSSSSAVPAKQKHLQLNLTQDRLSLWGLPACEHNFETLLVIGDQRGHCMLEQAENQEELKRYKSTISFLLLKLGQVANCCTSQALAEDTMPKRNWYFFPLKVMRLKKILKNMQGYSGKDSKKLLVQV